MVRPPLVALMFAAAATGRGAEAIPDLGQFCAAAVRRAEAAGPALRPAADAARSVFPRLAAAAGDPAPPTPHTLGAALAEYARRPAGEPVHFESFAEAAARLADGGATARRTPAATSRWLDERAVRIEAELNALGSPEAAPLPPAVLGAAADLRVVAALARFHAHRLLTAVHHQLFRRQLKLPELVAATYRERDALRLWRALLAAAEAGPETSADGAPARRDLLPHWRAEEQRLAANVRDLEEQCCPPDASLNLNDIWRPAADAEVPRPAIAHVPPARAPAGRPVLLAARADDPAAIRDVRLHYRGGDVPGAFSTLDLRADGRGGFHGEVPAALATPGASIVYFLEVRDARGRGAHWPDLDHGAPHVTVRIEP